jgi:hypothetical protein
MTQPAAKPSSSRLHNKRQAEWPVFFGWLTSEDGGCCVEAKQIGDGLYAAIKPLMFHWTMIVGMVGDRFGHEDRWCYENQDLAERGLREWSGDGDPVGWNRHVMSGRSRPGGDPRLEYVAP